MKRLGMPVSDTTILRSLKEHARARSENGAVHVAGVVTLPCGEREVSSPQELNCQAAATAVRHVSIAAARSVRCVWADVRWRWTLNVL